MSLTSANAIVTLAIPNLYPVPQNIQGFSTEDIFSVAEVEPSGNLMGADGRVSTFWKPFLTELTITLQGDSPSLDVFLNWAAAMKVTRESITCEMFISLSAIRKKWVLSQGSLIRARELPDTKDMIQPVPFTISGILLPANI